ncbi:MAG: glucose-6-phosphate isomerase, partial [Acidimicrobiia bacterium]
MTPITSTSEWETVEGMAADGRNLDLRSAFAADPNRANRLTYRAGDLTVDLSKHLVTDDILNGLMAIADRSGLPQR